MLSLCVISLLRVLFIFIYSRKYAHIGKKRKFKRLWQLLFWYSVLFCRLRPDVVTSGDASMTTAVNRELALCLTDVEGKPPPPPSLLLLLLLLFYFFFFSFVFFIQCRRDRSRRADCVGTIHRQRRSEAGWNMSGEKATSPCNKFQANIFNKSKCQNCFKSRELHLLNDHDMEQVSQR